MAFIQVITKFFFKKIWSKQLIVRLYVQIVHSNKK